MPETDDISRSEFDKTVKKVDEHHEKIADLERFNASIPDAESLRRMEHVVEEMPETDDIKKVVDSNKGKTLMLHRIFIGTMIIVFGTLALAIASSIWHGVEVTVGGVL